MSSLNLIFSDLSVLDAVKVVVKVGVTVGSLHLLSAFLASLPFAVYSLALSVLSGRPMSSKAKNMFTGSSTFSSAVAVYIPWMVT